ncbi:disks large homolog 4 [Eucyclogobius newberryi]|uniref:disks large homolog 4 n=1 Tax=Eucyclogobius newberryi TaxID=166745 RepID=UPI003B5AF3FD
MGSSVCGDSTLHKNLCSTSGQPRPVPAPEQSPQVPLKLQIRVSGQRGSLGISIAGGQGSLPYKQQDEGIFISRVTKGGPSDKAGVHVGDQLLEVNGLCIVGATHQYAVSALRNAGSSIRIKVLRDPLPPREEPLDVQVKAGKQLSCLEAPAKGGKLHKMNNTHNYLSRKIEAVVCNGNGMVDLKKEIYLPETKKEPLRNEDSYLEERHTMPIPRIILTHPSTSDEDVELLTRSPSREKPFAFDICNRQHIPDCFDGAFYPP